MLPVFDGHNDALTHEDHANLVAGRDGGHLDLPRMHEGGMRGGIFAVFTPSPETRSGPRRFGSHAYREPLAKPVEQGAAAAHATAVGGRLLRLEREGHLKLARRIGDIDAAHNEAGFWDVARLEPGPLVASHSGAHALCPASRNLTNVQLDAIGNSGGLVGIVFATAFLRPDFGDTTETPLALIVEHVRYVAERIGPQHVALGSDFDGATIPAELGDVAGLPKLVDALRLAGFAEDELTAICWHNWRRALDAWWR
jgi:microsomal dipeptidase-like Zn-dependent dipeptidase